eukprot:SM000239S08062  [mRNA]  locus=s239:129108:130952:+ [translate_table: standard]
MSLDTEAKSSAVEGGSAVVSEEDEARCAGKYIHIYSLPPQFNSALLDECATMLPWSDMCPHLEADGLGQKVTSTETVLVPAGRWFATHQISLELMLLARLKKSYPCLMSDPSQGNLFYIPYYSALDVQRWHFKTGATSEDHDRLPLQLAAWLKEQEAFKKNRGRDHVLVLSKSTWDFRRKEGSAWGNVLLELPELKHVTKLLLEGDPWEQHDIAVPHATYFHPKTDNELNKWQVHVDGYKKNSLISFAGVSDLRDSMKQALSLQCKESNSECRYMECSDGICSQPEAIMGLHLGSTFCLQAPGHVAARRVLFDALVAGCIPVVFDTYFFSQFRWHLPEDNSTYSVYIPEASILDSSNPVKVIDVLKEISPDRVRDMQQHIVWNVLPRIIYNHPRSKIAKTKDAFDISIERLLEDVAQLRANTFNEGSSST